jgi:hypothetical protein
MSFSTIKEENKKKKEKRKEKRKERHVAVKLEFR